MVKVEMTRWLEPMECVSKLEETSGAFNFGMHAIYFSNDAVGVEAEVHRRVAEPPINRVKVRSSDVSATCSSTTPP